jgi:hypothetical protein
MSGLARLDGAVAGVVFVREERAAAVGDLRAMWGIRRFIERDGGR